jgi:uncharacterized protein involved in response to NO
MLIPLAALSRYLGSAMPDMHDAATLLAGALWLAAFLLASLSLMPAWLLPRPPRPPVGKPPK